MSSAPPATSSSPPSSGALGEQHDTIEVTLHTEEEQRCHVTATPSESLELAPSAAPNIEPQSNTQPKKLSKAKLGVLGAIGVAVVVVVVVLATLLTRDDSSSCFAAAKDGSGEPWADACRTGHPVHFLNDTCEYQNCFQTNCTSLDLGRSHKYEILPWTGNRYSSVCYKAGIPPQIGELTNLEVLKLGYNGLGAFGDSAEEERFMKAFVDGVDELQWQEADSQIPSSLGRARALEHLDLSGNYLKGSIPSELMALPRLKHLDLSLNQLFSKIPSEIGQLTNLEVLKLDRYNAGDGLDKNAVLPSEIGNLSRLRELYLVDISYPTADFRERADSCRTSLPTELGRLSNLETLLMMSADNVFGSIPTEVGRLSALKHAVIYDSGIRGTIPSELGQLASLETLRIEGERGLTGTIPTELGLLRNLKYLAIKGTAVTGSIPTELGQLAELRSLEIEGEHGWINGSLPTELGKLVQLTHLAVDNTRIGLPIADPSTPPACPVPSELGNLVNLIELSLAENGGLTGTIPLELSNLTSLRLMDLAGSFRYQYYRETENSDVEEKSWKLLSCVEYGAVFHPLYRGCQHYFACHQSSDTSRNDCDDLSEAVARELQEMVRVPGGLRHLEPFSKLRHWHIQSGHKYPWGTTTPREPLHANIPLGGLRSSGYRAFADSFYDNPCPSGQVLWTKSTNFREFSELPRACTELGA